MDSSVKNSAKYLIGIIIVLLIIASVFFGLANKGSSFDSQYVQKLIEDNKALEVDLRASTLKNAEYQSTIALLEQSIASAAAQDAQNNNQQLAACVVSDDVLSVQKRLIDTQSNYISCSNELNAKQAAFNALSLTHETLQTTVNESQLTNLEVSVLNDKLALTTAEYADLELRFEQLLAQNQALNDTASANAPLNFTDFSLTPVYCDQRFEPEWVCVQSIDIDAAFNFTPDAQLSVRLVDPMGEVIGRKNVESRVKNRIQFVTSRDDPLLVGAYTVEFIIDGVFNEQRSFELLASQGSTDN